MDKTTLDAQRVAHLLGGDSLKDDGRKLCLFAPWESCANLVMACELHRTNN